MKICSCQKFAYMRQSKSCRHLEKKFLSSSECKSSSISGRKMIVKEVLFLQSACYFKDHPQQNQASPAWGWDRVAMFVILEIFAQLLPNAEGNWTLQPIHYFTWNSRDSFRICLCMCSCFYEADEQSTHMLYGKPRCYSGVSGCQSGGWKSEK